MEYVIVPMDRSHLKQIAELEQQCFSQPWSEAALEEELYNPQASFIVADDGEGGVLGYAGLHVILDEGYIANVAVEEAARRHGVASALMDVYCRFGQEHLAFLTLEVRESNKSAIGLYLKHGFEEVARRKNFYSDPQEDAIIMTREFKRGGDAEQKD
jgi:ribosomal-protein-alanine N-acetyltransferase